MPRENALSCTGELACDALLRRTLSEDASERASVKSVLANNGR